MTNQSNIPPRIIGLAIAEVADDRIRGAWQYTEAWRVLTAAGVPVHDLRHALECRQVPTQARDIVRDWARAGSRGLLVLHGPPGTGKTFAAARWCVARQAAGRGVTWQLAAKWPYAFAEQDAWVKRGRDASGLVIDDMGTGETAAPKATEAIEAMLLVRLADSKPTILLSNANAAETERALGGRLWDRLKLAGGIHEISERPSLRKRDTVEVDSAGRSPTWHTSAAIGAAVGCEMVDGSLRIGGALGTAEANDKARELLGLDLAALLERAAAIRARELETYAKLRRDFGVEIDTEQGLTFGAFTAGMVAKARAGAAAARQQREADLRERMGRKIPAQLHPGDVDIARAMAERAGFYVRGNADVGFDVVGPAGVVVRGVPSNARAWIAAAMCEPPREIGEVA